MRTVSTGWLAGQPIRKARKSHRCDYWHGSLEKGGRCKKAIRPGDYYVEGDGADYSENPWACERYCRDCVGEEARRDMPAPPPPPEPAPIPEKDRAQLKVLNQILSDFFFRR